MGRKLILKRSRSFLSSTPLMKRRVYSVLSAISSSYPHLKGRLPTCSSPVRHSRREASSSLAVRLACLRRAASVRSEPGSNSPSLLFQTALKARPDFQVCSLKNYSFKGIFSRGMNLIKPFLKALKDSLQFNSS